MIEKKNILNQFKQNEQLTPLCVQKLSYNST